MDGRVVCYEGPTEYMRAMLSRLQASPLAEGWENFGLAEGWSCAAQKFTAQHSPFPDACFPHASKHTSHNKLLTKEARDRSILGRYAEANGEEFVDDEPEQPEAAEAEEGAAAGEGEDESAAAAADGEAAAAGVLSVE